MVLTSELADKHIQKVWESGRKGKSGEGGNWDVGTDLGVREGKWEGGKWSPRGR
jgi:hypothetical protein